LTGLPPTPAEIDAAMNKGLAWLVEQVEYGKAARSRPHWFLFRQPLVFCDALPDNLSVAARRRALLKRPAAAT
jgi:hypothetical protein